MVARWIRLIVGAGCLAATVVWGGCARWNADRWDVDQYRDQRVTDIEQRLSRTKPIVENPF